MHTPLLKLVQWTKLLICDNIKKNIAAFQLYKTSSVSGSLILGKSDDVKAVLNDFDAPAVNLSTKYGVNVFIGTK